MIFIKALCLLLFITRKWYFYLIKKPIIVRATTILSASIKYTYLYHFIFKHLKCFIKKKKTIDIYFKFLIPIYIIFQETKFNSKEFNYRARTRNDLLEDRCSSTVFFSSCHHLRRCPQSITGGTLGVLKLIN